MKNPFDNEMNKHFVPKRKSAILLSDSFKRLNLFGRSERVSNCSTMLTFSFEMIDDVASSSGKLIQANFCRDRLCPMCSWRRSLKVFSHVSKVVYGLQSDYDFVFVTFTIPSVTGSELNHTLDRLFDAWKRLTNRPRFKQSICGGFRALEITRNDNPRSKSYGLYHPHFHCIFAVKSDYWKSNYIKQSELLDLWRHAYQDDSITQVDIRRCRSKNGSADISSSVAEVAKYTVKDTEYIKPDNPDLTDQLVSDLAVGLNGRRLVSYFGIFKSTHKSLNLDDSIDGDLTNVSGDLHPDINTLICTYGWSCGAYKLINASIKTS